MVITYLVQCKVSIFKDVNSLIHHQKAGEWQDAGHALGDALEKLLVGMRKQEAERKAREGEKLLVGMRKWRGGRGRVRNSWFCDEEAERRTREGMNEGMHEGVNTVTITNTRVQELEGEKFKN
jgi:hypothetical protein